MKQYLDLLYDIRHNGYPKADRTGTGTLATFGKQMRFNLDDGFPCLTTKKLHLKSIIHELLWFLNGDTNIKYLNDNGVKIWNEWADDNGNLGPIYGKQWRDWKAYDKVDTHAAEYEWVDEQFIERSIDQIQDTIDLLKNDPFSRRIIVNAWNVAELKKMALTPCHCMFQFFVREPTIQEQAMWGHDKLRLSCMLTQRSCDFFLGVSFNIASYALLTMMFAQCVDMVPDEFIWSGGDTHLYLNHLDQADEQLSRKPYSLPTMRINPDVKDIFSFKYEDFALNDYQCHPSIKAPISV